MRHRALLFGNSVFNDDADLVRLEGPPTDLSLMVGALTNAPCGLHDRADVASYLDRPKNEMLDLMEAFFGQSEPDDQLLLYYSGHGVRDTENNLYLCARDSYRKRPVRTAVSDTEINAFIQDGAARRVVIVLDCCFSGSFKGGDDTIPERLGSGRFVLSSSRRSELSEDAAKPGEGSVFTRFFVEALLATDADVDRDGFVTLGEIYGHLLPRLRAASKQIPQRSYDNAIGDPLIGRTRPRPVAVDPPDAALPPSPELEVSETDVAIKGVQLGEELPVESIDVFDKNGGKIDWTVESGEPWIGLTKRDGFFEMRLQPPKIGINRGLVYVRAMGRPGSRKLRITVMVDEPIQKPLQVEPVALALGAMTVGKAKRSSIRVHHGAGPISAECDDARVKIVVKADLLDVTVLADAPGEIDTELRVSAPNGQLSVPVKARVEVGPILKLNPGGSVDFGQVTRGETRSSRVEIANVGSGQLEWTCAKERGDFFDFTTDKGSVVDVQLRDAAPGIHHGALRISSNGGTATIDVQAQIVAPTALPQPQVPPPQPFVQAPVPPVFSPGRWQIDIAMLGVPSSRVLLDFAPNGTLAGTLQLAAMPLPMPVQGWWSFDMFRQQLGMQIFGAGMQDQVGIQLLGVQGASLQGTNGAGFTYLLTRLA